jgi:2-C-methyl-D-erythritol 4-phosphate cytidylyltransferase
VTSRYFAVIPAAGTATRFGTAGLKQYALLAGKLMLRHAIERLLALEEIELLFVLLAKDDARFRAADWGEFGERLAPLYCGGASRRDTVLNGLIACASAVDPNDWILVHDAARPFVGIPELRRLIDEVGNDPVGGILAVPVVDTVKRGDEERRIVSTEPREGLWQAQTPQMFRHGMLLRALREAEHVTDEAGAVERLGYKPMLIEGSTRNFKVTHPSDLEIGEALLRGGV